MAGPLERRVEHPQTVRGWDKDFPKYFVEVRVKVRVIIRVMVGVRMRAVSMCKIGMKIRV